MKVLQINVRLQEGGAARIALDLHRQLNDSGIESRFAYGWGEKGGRSLFEANVPFGFQVGQQIQVASNMLLHRVMGIDCVPPVGLARRALVEAIRWADVIHLHVIHSYFLPIGWLIKELTCAHKPVVWTAHDYWMLTGRCASTEGCEGWKNGCGCCRTQENYPPSLMDLSASQFAFKRASLARLGSSLHVVSPSEFVAESIREGFPGLDVRVIPNWIDSEFEMALCEVQMSNAPMDFAAEKIKVLVVANDLSDPTKVDRELINKLMEVHHIEIHTVGQNSPFVAAGVVNHGRISQRTRMVEIITAADVALFTSVKDTFGLVMIEALACGVPVFAVDSSAAREVLRVIGIRPIENKLKIVNLLRNRELPSCYSGMSRAVLRDDISRHFGQAVAVSRYVAAYEEAMTSQ